MCDRRRDELSEMIVLVGRVRMRISLVVPEFAQGDWIEGAQYPEVLLRAVRRVLTPVHRAFIPISPRSAAPMRIARLRGAARGRWSGRETRQACQPRGAGVRARHVGNIRWREWAQFAGKAMRGTGSASPAPIWSRSSASSRTACPTTGTTSRNPSRATRRGKRSRREMHRTPGSHGYGAKGTTGPYRPRGGESHPADNPSRAKTENRVRTSGRAILILA